MYGIKRMKSISEKESSLVIDSRVIPFLSICKMVVTISILLTLFSGYDYTNRTIITKVQTQRKCPLPHTPPPQHNNNTAKSPHVCL